MEHNFLTAHFFLQGYARTGKTFLYTAIYHHFRAKEEIILCVAFSGIAALLFSGKSTSYSRFRIPLNSYQDFTCPVSKGTQIAGLLERTALIIWDEMPMQNKYDFEVMDLLLKDFRGNDVSFGGVSVIFGEDFAQIFLMVKRANRARTVAANIQ